MTNEELQKKIEYYDKLAQKNYDNYQDTGEQRYYRAYNNYEELGDVFRQVLSSNDEHRRLLHLESLVNQVIGMVDNKEYLQATQLFDLYKKAMRELKAGVRI